MMPGGRSVFPTLTVKENLRLAGWTQAPATRRAGRRRRGAGARACSPGCATATRQLAGDLSGGEQQMLAISQALMPDPTLLLIDELSLGLAPTVVGQLIEVVHQTHETGVTIVRRRAVDQRRAAAGRAGRVHGEGRVPLHRSDHASCSSAPSCCARCSSAAPESGDAGQAEAAAPPEGDDERLDDGATSRRADARAPPDEAPVILEVRDVRKRFGGITAVDRCRPRARARARSSASSARTAPARRRSSTASPASSRSTAGASSCSGDDIARPRPPRAGRSGVSVGRSRRPACSRRSPRRRRWPSPASATSCRAGFVAAAFAQPVARTSEADVASKVDLLIDLMGLGAFREQAHRRAVDRHPPHRRAGLPAGRRSRRDPPRRAVAAASPSARPRRSVRCCSACRPTRAPRSWSSSTTCRCSRRSATACSPSSSAP